MPEFPRWEHWRPSAYGDYDDNNSKQQPDTAELLQAILLGIELHRYKPYAPRLGSHAGGLRRNHSLVG